jgi:hypothetical protein
MIDEALRDRGVPTDHLEIRERIVDMDETAVPPSAR